MKKILIVTLYGNFNYGNKLQNYAVQEIYKSLNCEPYTLTYPENKIKLKSIVKNILGYKTINDKRIINFKKFDNYINKISEKDLNANEFNCISLGSDQIWNPNDIMSNYFVRFVNSIHDINKISFSASIAVNDIPDDFKEDYVKHFTSMKFISVREEQGKILIEHLINKKNIEVLLDPTMIVPTEKWDNVMHKPSNIKDGEKFILNYFLGELSEDRKNEINRIAKENNCKIINILDSNDEFYISGPDEFLWLEKNAFLICTDSFHSSVFSILFEKPFIVFNREDGQNGVSKTNSRLETLLKKFNLQNRYYIEKMPDNIFNIDYSHVSITLNNERNKAISYLKKALKDGGSNEE